MAAPQTNQHKTGSQTSIYINYYTEIVDKRFLYYLLDIEDGEEESAIVSESSRNENKREESGVAPNEDHSEGKIENDLVLLMKTHGGTSVANTLNTPNIYLVKLWDTK